MVNNMFIAIADAYKTWSENQHIKKDEKEKALSLVRTALLETKHYVSSLNNGAKDDKKKEYELSKLWSEASQYARKIDPDLAQRLHEKSNYWLNPENYSIEEAFQKGIRLERIDADLKEALEYLS